MPSHSSSCDLDGERARGVDVGGGGDEVVAGDAAVPLVQLVFAADLMRAAHLVDASVFATQIGIERGGAANPAAATTTTSTTGTAGHARDRSSAPPAAVHASASVSDSSTRRRRVVAEVHGDDDAGVVGEVKRQRRPERARGRARDAEQDPGECRGREAVDRSVVEAERERRDEDGGGRAEARAHRAEDDAAKQQLLGGRGHERERDADRRRAGARRRPE